MTHGYNFIAFIMGLTVLVIAVTVMFDAYTEPVVSAASRFKNRKQTQKKDDSHYFGRGALHGFVDGVNKAQRSTHKHRRGN